jgi:hypothetical protein
MSTATDMIDVLEERLDAILARPSMWGGAEAVELQILLLLELRMFAAMPALRLRAPDVVMKLHSELVQQRFPDAGPRTLAELSDGPDELARELSVLRQMVMRTLHDPDCFRPADHASPIPAPETLGQEDVAVPFRATSPGPMPRRTLERSKG